MLSRLVSQRSLWIVLALFLAWNSFLFEKGIAQPPWMDLPGAEFIEGDTGGLVRQAIGYGACPEDTYVRKYGQAEAGRLMLFTPTNLDFVVFNYHQSHRTVPFELYAESSQKRIEQILLPHRDLVQRLRSQIPITAELQDNKRFQFSSWLSNEGGKYFLRVAGDTVAVPEASLSVEERSKIDEALKRREGWDSWFHSGARVSIGSKFIAKTPVGFVMEGLICQNIAIDSVQFLVPFSSMDRVSIDKVDAKLKEPGANSGVEEMPFPKWLLCSSGGLRLLTYSSSKPPREQLQAPDWFAPRIHTSITNVRGDQGPLNMHSPRLQFLMGLQDEICSKGLTIQKANELLTDSFITEKEKIWVGDSLVEKSQSVSRWLLLDCFTQAPYIDDHLIGIKDRQWIFWRESCSDRYIVPEDAIEPSLIPAGYDTVAAIERNLKSAVKPIPGLEGASLQLMRVFLPPETILVETQLTKIENTSLDSIVDVPLKVMGYDGRITDKQVAPQRVHPADWNRLVGLVGSKKQKGKTASGKSKGTVDSGPIQLGLHLRGSITNSESSTTTLECEMLLPFAHGYLALQNGTSIFIPSKLLQGPEGESLRVATEESLKRWKASRREVRLAASRPDFYYFGNEDGRPLIGTDFQLRADGHYQYKNQHRGIGVVLSNSGSPLFEEVTIHLELIAKIKYPSGGGLPAFNNKIDAGLEKELNRIKNRPKPVPKVLIYFKDNLPGLEANFEGIEGDVAVFAYMSPYTPFKIALDRLESRTIDEVKALDAQREGGLGFSSKKLLAPENIQLEWVFGAEGVSSYPLKPVRMEGRNVLFEDAYGEKISWHSTQLLPSEYWRLVRSLTLPPIDETSLTNLKEELKRDVADKKIIHPLETVPDELKKRVLELCRPNDGRWSLSTLDTEKAITTANWTALGKSIRVDENAKRHAILSPGPNGGTSAIKLEVPYDSDKPVYFGAGGKQVVFFENDILKVGDLVMTATKDLARVAEVRVVAKATPEIFSSVQSKSLNRVYALLADATLMIVEPTTKKFKKVSIPFKRSLDRQTVFIPEERKRIYCNESGTLILIQRGKRVDSFRMDLRKGELEYLAGASYPEPPGLVAMKGTQYAFTLDGQQLLSIGTTDMRFSPIKSVVMPVNAKILGFSDSSDGKDGYLQVIGAQAESEVSKTNPLLHLSFSHTPGMVFRPTIVTDLDGTYSLSPDGKSLLITSQGRLHIASPPPITEMDMRQFKDLIYELMEQGKWAELDAIWRTLGAGEMREWEAYPGQFADGFFNQVAFACSDFRQKTSLYSATRRQEVIEYWKKIMPESQLPKLLEVQLLVEEAWAARGTGFASSVSEDGARVFDEKMSAALEKLRDQKLLVSSAQGYFLALSAITGLGGDPASLPELMPSLQNSNWFSNPLAHHQMAVLLLPRWHGAPGDSEAYIEAVSKRIGGIAGDRIYAGLMLHIANFYPHNLPIQQSLECDLERICRGVQSMNFAQNYACNGQAFHLFAVSGRPDLAKQLWDDCLTKGIPVWTGPNWRALVADREAMGLKASQKQRK